MGGAVSSAEALEPPQHIGRYEVLTKLSSGGMAELYLATVPGPRGFRRFVAIKRILPTLRHEEEFVAMFLDEARITASLAHANIAQLYDLAEDGNELFIAMELVAGQDLSRIQRGVAKSDLPLPLGLSTQVVRDACLALHYAHHFTSPSGRPLPVIHRDLTPSNVMLTYTGTTKLIDFGIAKARGGLSTTQLGHIKGSIAYMSPEQVRGEELTGRSDLFSAGIVLWELLTGRRLFHTGDDASTMYRVLNHEVTPPHQLHADIGRPLSDVVMKALQRDPEQRYASGRDMAKAIEDTVGGRIFQEEDSARWMAEHFGAAIARTQELLSVSDDPERIARAARRMKLQTGEVPTQPGSGSDVATMTLAEPVRSGTLLIVDDTQVGRMLVERMLAHDGHRIISAGSGREALEIVAQLTPDAIILDINMPEMNGFELCQRIRAQENLRSTPVIFLSAQCSLEERQKGIEAGGDDFLRKPYQAEELSTLVRRHLRRAQMMR
jgi:CheY-like chemotaxis protein